MSSHAALGVEPTGRGAASRYGVAIGIAAVGVVCSLALKPVVGETIFAPLLGATAIAVWYGGLLPGLAAMALGWLADLVLLSDPPFSFHFERTADRTNWIASFAVAVAIVWVTSALRAAQAGATARAAEARRAGRQTERLQALASALSAAAAPSDVARALVERGAEALGAHGGSLALVVGEELEIVDPGAARGQTIQPGTRLPLSSRAAVAEAVRTGELRSSATRAETRERFPDGMAVAPTARGVIAVPVRAAGEIVGAVGFQYTEDGAIDDERLALAALAADLGGQALERARMYDDERGLREGLDRVLRVAPRAGGSGAPADVAAEICGEARRTFGSDVALMLSIVDEHRFAVDWREPRSVLAPPGLLLSISDLPDLAGAMATGDVMWVPDMFASLRGEALELAKSLGTVSALRIPVAVAGRVDRVLVLQWQRRVGDPTPTQLALARRFADQAGLALEQAERRRAEEEAASRADETRRLLDVTSALARAVTSAEVVDAVLAQGAQALGAHGGIVGLRAGDEVVVAGVTGRDPEDAEPGSRIALAEATPLTDAIRRAEPVVIESPDERRRRYPLAGPLELRAQAFVAVPFESQGSAIGAAGFAFERPRRLDEGEREFLAAFSRQASQALERARLHEAEHASRGRAEQVAARLAQLHALAVALGRARTAAEVAEAVARQIVGVLGARSVFVYAVDESGETIEVIGHEGVRSAESERYLRVPVASDFPLAWVVRTGEPAWSDRQREGHFDDPVWRSAGALAWGIVPLSVQERVVGALAVTFASAGGLDDEARRFVETVARQAAQPLARVQVLEAERGAREAAEGASRRTRGLQEVTEALAAAATPAEVGEVAVRQGVAALDASAGALYLAPPGASGLVLAARAGGSAGEPWLEAGSPVDEVVRTGEVRELPDDGADGEPRRSGICVPLASASGVLGALSLTFAGRERISAEERDVVIALATQCAQALERARLLEAEQAATARLRRLQAVTAALSGAARVEEVGSVCLEEARAALGARGGMVAVLSEDGETLEPVATDGSEHARRTPIPLRARTPIAEAARLADAVWTGDGAVALPLVSARGVVGAMRIDVDPSALGEEDRAWLAALAGQCAQAIERSRLYELERTVRMRIERLQRLTAALSTALTPGQIAAVTVVAGSDALDAPVGLVAVVSDDGELLEAAGSRGLPDELVDRLVGDTEGARTPLRDVVADRRLLVLQSAAEIEATYPNLGADEGRIRSLVVAPLIAAERLLGAALFAWEEQREFRPDERIVFETVAAQCAQAFDRARRYESERLIAETLQRSVLPDRLPELPGVALAGRYLPGTAGMEVGGDWFDVIQLENGRLGLVVGDVVGKGVRAASAMGQLRNALRAFALELLKPATAVGRLNALMESLGESPFATLAYLTLDPARRVCRYTIAGHPPPLVLRPDGTVEMLSGGRSLPIGVGADVHFEQAVVKLEPGSTVLLYTDGLVERRDRSIDEGFAALSEALAAADGAEPEELVAHVLERMLAHDLSDDVAILAVQLA